MDGGLPQVNYERLWRGKICHQIYRAIKFAINSKNPLFSDRGLCLFLLKLILPPRFKAIPAIDRFLAVGLEGDCGAGAAGAAYGGIHLAVMSSAGVARATTPAVLVFFSGPALGTTARIIGKSFGCEKRLFTGGERKITTAIFTDESLVTVH